MTIYITKEFDPYFISIIDDVTVETARIRLHAFLNQIGADLEDILEVESYLDGICDHCTVNIYDGLRLADIYHFDFE